MRPFYQRHEYLFIALFALLIQSFVPFVMSGYYPDTDNYTHARRLLDFFETKTWTEIRYMYSNYPYGELLHFTRITDIFWGLCALPLIPFLSLKESVFWGGMIYQAVVSVLSAVTLLWGLRAIGKSPMARLLAVAFFFLQPSTTETYIFTKPDHHVLTGLFAFLTIGGLLHHLAQKKDLYLWIAGLGAALNLWTAAEGVLISYAVLLPLTLLAVAGKLPFRMCALYSLSFFTFSLLFLIINPPYEGFFTPDNGRLSFLFVVIIGLTYLSMQIMAEAERLGKIQKTSHRFIGLAVLACISAGITVAVFSLPVIIASPFPSQIRLWSNNVVELQSSLKRPVLFFLCFFPQILCLIAGIFAGVFGAKDQRNGLAIVWLPLLIFSVSTIFALRYGRLGTQFLPFVLLYAFTAYAARFGTAVSRWKDRNQKIALGIVYVFLALFLGINYTAGEKGFNSQKDAYISTLANYFPKTEGAILSDVFTGPELIWLTDEKVVGTPYHRNVEGIADNLYIFYGTDENTVIKLLKKHRVKAIFTKIETPDDPNFAYKFKRRYETELGTDFKNILFYRLFSGRDLPCGIEEDLNMLPPYVLYTVDFSKCDKNTLKIKDK